MNKLIIDREGFLDKLQKANKFTGDEKLVPAFKNFLLQVNAEENSVTIIASNGSIQIRLKCTARATNSFAVCVNAGWLIGNVGLYHDNEVTIIQSEEMKENGPVHKVNIKCGKSKGEITCDCLPDQFPILSIGTVTSEMSISQAILKAGLKTAEKFVNENDPNGSRIAVNIAEVDHKIVFTGLDHGTMCRAAMRPLSITKWNAVPIPTETSSLVVALLQDKGEIAVVHDGAKIIFFTGSDSIDSFFEITSVTSTAKFPDTESLFRNVPTSKVVINTSEFRDATKRLKLYAEVGKVASMKLVMDNPSEIHMSAIDSLSGKNGDEFIGVDNHEGYTLEKGFNNDYFLKILACVDTNEFELYFSNELTKPSFVMPHVNSEEERVFTFLIANMGSSQKKKK